VPFDLTASRLISAEILRILARSALISCFHGTDLRAGRSDFLKVSMLDRRQFLAASAVTGAALAAMPAIAESPTMKIKEPWTDEQLVKRNGGVIRCVSMGTGPAVVLMPKLGGWAADWRHVAPILATKYRVVVIEPPGHGGSKMATPAPYIQTVPESAAMIRATLDELGIEPYALGGNSLGGCISVVMAGLWPQDTPRLILLSVALGAKATRAEIKAEDDAEAPRTYDAQGNPLPRPFSNTNARFGMTEEINNELNASRATAGPWARSSERGVGIAGIADYLPRITARTLLVYGGTGAYLKYRDVGLAKLHDARTVAIADTGSFPHQQKPTETAAALMEFLAT
jgi:pimeloyl-ACP methyl ester carboxylesterase